MDQRDRLNIIKSLGARGLSACVRCNLDVRLDDNIVVTKVDKKGTYRLSNVRLRHRACAIVSVDLIVNIFARGPLNQRCYVCQGDLTIVNDLSELQPTLGVYHDGNGIPYLVHITCVWKLPKS
jgi:hypothetical protein